LIDIAHRISSFDEILIYERLHSLIYRLHQTQFQGVFAWFLQLPACSSDTNQSNGNNSLIKTIHAQTELRLGIIETNPQRTYHAMAELLPRLLDFYPLDADLTHGCIVSCIDLMTNQSITSTDIDQVLELLANIPETLFLKLHPETAETLSDIIQRATMHYALLDSERLTEAQRSIASKLTVLAS
jgi:hypothetical protein